MAMDIENSPFVKQLASSDRATRDKALESLRVFLYSNRSFTELELLKLWRGLFFFPQFPSVLATLTSLNSILLSKFYLNNVDLSGMWHSDRPKTQQRLALALSHLVLPLPESLFVPFLRAFWTTMTNQYPLMDGLRLDKFLLLMRFYANAAFTYLAQASWLEALLGEYLKVIEELLLEAQGKVSDGLRYHVLDLWIDELEKVEGEDKCPLERLMQPMERLSKEGRTKMIRERAKECLADERLKDWGAAETPEAGPMADDEENEWSGIEDA